MQPIKKTAMKSLCLTAALTLLASVALAKLPAPSDEAKAKAAEAAAKTAWAGKVDAYKLCLAQNKVVSHYKKVPEPKAVKAPAKGAAPAAPASAPAGACADPGPFVYTPNTAVAPAAPAPAAPASVAAAKKP